MRTDLYTVAEALLERATADGAPWIPDTSTYAGMIHWTALRSHLAEELDGAIEDRFREWRQARENGEVWWR